MTQYELAESGDFPNHKTITFMMHASLNRKQTDDVVVTLCACECECINAVDTNLNKHR